MTKIDIFHEETGLTIRNAVADDLARIIELDESSSGINKPDYWQESFRRFGSLQDGRYFLVAEKDSQIVGFIIGEIRAWEFGSQPGGWVFSLTVDPGTRLAGVATVMFNTICQCFRQAGVDKVHTMIDRDNITVMAFFRSQGMMAASTIPLQLSLSDMDNAGDLS
ncbi:MAG: GNAT family N-acetyltransferase [Alphaproteobacteria bacterium]|nr:MAG: GNAT family N-acetyltransferase [Alphaproteobacteria bacterium]